MLLAEFNTRGDRAMTGEEQMPTVEVIAKTLHGSRDGVLTDDSGSPVLILDGTPFSPEDLRAHILPIEPPDAEAIAMLERWRLCNAE